MNNNKYIEFKKQRELGDLLGDSFAFLRAQFKPFFTSFFKIVGPYLLVFLISFVFYTNSYKSFFNFTIETSNDNYNPIMMIGSLALFFIASVVAYAASQAMTLYYIKIYIEEKRTPTFQEVKKEVYGSFWNFFGLTFLVVMCVGIGLVICFLPGIYLAVPLSMSFGIMVFERKSIGEAFSNSFTLVRDNWWISFAYLLVIVIIISVAGYAFSMPATIYAIMKMGIFSGEIDPANMIDSIYDPIGIILNVLGMLFQFGLNIILVIFTILMYFNLNEKKNHTGTLERIGNLGKNSEQ